MINFIYSPNSKAGLPINFSPCLEFRLTNDEEPTNVLSLSLTLLEIVEDGAIQTLFPTSTDPIKTQFAVITVFFPITQLCPT